MRVDTASRLRLWGLGLLLSFLCACGDRECRPKTADDRAALEAARFKWGHKYEFDCASDSYWGAKLKADAPEGRPEMSELLELFDALLPREKQVTSEYVYLNVYSDTGEFIVQLHRTREGAVQTSQVEFH